MQRVPKPHMYLCWCWCVTCNLWCNQCNRRRSGVLLVDNRLDGIKSSLVPDRCNHQTIRLSSLFLNLDFYEITWHAKCYGTTWIVSGKRVPLADRSRRSKHCKNITFFEVGGSSTQILSTADFLHFCVKICVERKKKKDK